jgi:hypothetical protein
VGFVFIGGLFGGKFKNNFLRQAVYVQKDSKIKVHNRPLSAKE